ncbi:carboxypeptidase-like regulatory domain-containing protein [Streptomyces sp. Ru72]|uniref:carboxypeptidase-like regulatory domain-containing protein n=1 Tax=Streptomyces sp. Ru72 TaxID=2080747 RepID=UPI0035BE573B
MSADGHQPQAIDLTVGDRPAFCTVTLAGATGGRGTVRDVDGTPVTGATVVVIDARGDVVSTTTTGTEGEYALPGLLPGHFTLQVSADGHRPAAVAVEIDANGATRHDVTLKPEGMLTGTVLHGPSGPPVASAHITLLNADGVPVASATTTQDGTYTLTGLAPGAYTLLARGLLIGGDATAGRGEPDEAQDIVS